MKTVQLVSRRALALTSTVSLAFLAAATGVPTALADTDSATSRSTAVRVADLDLSTAAGRATAVERLHKAAHRLCFALSETTDLGHHEHYLRCVDETTAQAVSRLDALIERDAKNRFAQTENR